MLPMSLFSLSRAQEAEWHESIAWNVIYLSVPVFLMLYYVIPAPWGKLLEEPTTTTSNSGSNRHQQSSSPKLTDIFLYGHRIPARIAWVLFESPNLVWAVIAWRHRRDGDDETTNDVPPLRAANYILFGLFVAHYIQRAIIYPWRMSPNSKPMPLSIVLSGFFYCKINGYLQCRSLLYFYHFPDDWCWNPCFYIGLCLFFTGARINLQSDGILRALSRQKLKQQNGQHQRQRYQIPKGGWFEYCSTPHYFGEILEWTGFCIASHGSIASLSFCIFTAANLLPRGMAQHVWYQSYFNNGSTSRPRYPRHRKAVIPFLW